MIFAHQNLISFTYIVHTKSTNELISFGFSETLSESLSPNVEQLHFLADLSPNLGLSESLSKRLIQQELSYRKQIARQLRTQYVEGIYSPKYYTVTLKSMLRVTRGHWKRNHWTDRIRLTISRVI